MEPDDDSPSTSNEATPRDATQATDDQREVQDELDHRNDDPDAPGGHLDGDQMADET